MLYALSKSFLIFKMYQLMELGGKYLKEVKLSIHFNATS